MSPVLQSTSRSMASVLGCDLQLGDRVGSIGSWLVHRVDRTIPGRCTDRAAAMRGRCLCTSPLAVPDAMPRRVLRDPIGEEHLVFDHVRYAIAPRRGHR